MIGDPEEVSRKRPAGVESLPGAARSEREKSIEWDKLLNQNFGAQVRLFHGHISCEYNKF